jgi:alpha-L-fucosidase
MDTLTVVAEERRLCRPGEASDDVRIDPEIEGLIPPLSATELADLHRGIDAEGGCCDALVVWKGHGVLVDGHNRIRHCREKGYPFSVVEREFADRDAVNPPTTRMCSTVAIVPEAD